MYCDFHGNATVQSDRWLLTIRSNLLLQTTLKMEAAGSSATLVTTYQAIGVITQKTIIEISTAVKI